MSYNVFLWGFDSKLVRNAMANLEKDGIINIKKWFIAECFINDGFFSHRNEAEPFWTYKFSKKQQENEKCKIPPDYINHYMYNNMLVILHNLTRYTDNFRIPMHECLNIIDQLINQFYTLLLDKKPDIVIFVSVPHLVDGVVGKFLNGVATTTPV